MNTTKLKLPGIQDYFTQEAYNVLRTNIQFSGQDVKRIAITSCGMNEGKTVVSLHIGRSLAELGKKVLVVDADLRKSVMASRNASARGAKGLSEVLTGLKELPDCIYATQFENLHVMFAGQYPPNPVDLLDGKYFEDVLDAVGEVYDYVLIDTPPLGMVIDAAVIAAKCDSAIMIIGSTNTRYPQAQDVIEQLQKSGCNVLGVVLNNAEGSRRGYYYRKRYSYGGYYYSGKNKGKYQYRYGSENGDKSKDKAESKK